MDYEKLHRFRTGALGIVDQAIAFLEESPLCDVPPDYEIQGSGVYCLYYVGDFEPYSRLSELNAETPSHPIYVGKAVPKGWRTARVQGSTTAIIRGRLSEHARSIGAVGNLSLDDFRSRFIVLDEDEADLIVPVEASLIRLYTPLWNTQVDGFGNHDPGKGRYEQSPSAWDILHPGRQWVSRLNGQPPDLEAIHQMIANAMNA